MTQPRSKKVERAEDRPRKRTPLNVRNILKWADQEEGYVYRFVNNVEDRVQRFKDAGYEVVISKNVVGDTKGVSDPTPLTSHVEKSVGGGTKAVLMRTTDKFHEEDQKTMNEALDEIEKSMDPRYREEQLAKEGRLDPVNSGGWTGAIKVTRG